MPRQQLCALCNRHVGDASENIANQAWGSMSLSFAVMISVAMKAARSAHGETYWLLFRGIVRPEDKLDKNTLLSWSRVAYCSNLTIEPPPVA